MKCPFCGHSESKVTDSRTIREGSVIRRRRECETCQKRFTTYERLEEIEESMPLIVKKDGRREPFDPNKIKAGIRLACHKRPVAQDQIDAFIDALIQKLTEYPGKEVSSTIIGEEVMRFLYDTDKIAYIRFASVYKSFENWDRFLQEVEALAAIKKDG
jgi:transcriptional repressor NrdR